MAKSYQVFVGCPFLTAIRRNYDKLKSELESETPLHIVLADTVVSRQVVEIRLRHPRSSRDLSEQLFGSSPPSTASTLAIEPTLK